MSASPVAEVVHLAPKSGGLTRCCELPPFELPRGDRITNEPTLATCWTGSDPRLTEGADR